MSRLWREYDECQATALGELMDEYVHDHPGATDDEAYDAVCFDPRLRNRADQLFRAIVIHRTEHHA